MIHPDMKTAFPPKGKMWYVDEKYGNDSNDGLSPETAFATREHAEIMAAVKGDVIINTSSIITTGYMVQGPDPEQQKVRDRGWMIYPDPGEGRIAVMIVGVEE